MIFLPPELAQDAEATGEGTALGVKTDRMRGLYFRRTTSAATDLLADRELVRLVIDHAKKVVAHPSRPTLGRLESFSQNPHGELALEESLEESPRLDSIDDLRVETRYEKNFHCVCMLDSSSSMSGEKHLLASIAVAVLLLEVPPEEASVIVFSSDATSVKNLSVNERVEDTILRFLKQVPRGFTNIDRGLEEGVKQFGRLTQRRRKVGLIATDGRSTEGGDPRLRAKEYDFLVVLHLHGPGSDIDTSREMAVDGHGVCLEVDGLEELPRKMYEAVRMLSRR
jgi:Mg-chelatase subunit ChlD